MRKSLLWLLLGLFSFFSITGCGGTPPVCLFPWNSCTDPSTHPTNPTTPGNPQQPPATTSPTQSTLAKKLGCPLNLVVDTSNVYWIECDGAVRSISVNVVGSTGSTLLVPSGNGQGFDIAQRSGDLVFSIWHQSVASVPKMAPGPTVLADGSSIFPGCINTGIQPSGITVSSLGIDPFVADLCGVFQPLASGTIVPVWNATQLAPDYILAANNSNLYVAEFNVPNACIYVVPLFGGAGTPLIPCNLNYVTAIMTPTTGAGVGSVFWTEAGTSNDVKMCSFGCTTPTTLASGINTSIIARSLTVDDSYVFFGLANKIVKVPIDGGGAPTTVATSDSTRIAGIALSSDISDDCIYWLSQGGGSGTGSVQKMCPR